MYETTTEIDVPLAACEVLGEIGLADAPTTGNGNTLRVIRFPEALEPSKLLYSVDEFNHSTLSQIVPQEILFVQMQSQAACARHSPGTCRGPKLEPKQRGASQCRRASRGSISCPGRICPKISGRTIVRSGSIYRVRCMTPSRGMRCTTSTWTNSSMRRRSGSMAST